MTKILAIGATGNVGSEVVKQLVAAGQTPRIYVRDSAKARRLLGAKGYELAEGQLNDRDRLASAMKGVSGLYMVTFETPEYLTFLDIALATAKAAGVQHIVLMSAASDENSDIPFLRIHGLMERKVKESGLKWTILHPDWFMQNFLEEPERREVVFPTGPGKTSFIDARDIAAVAIKALTEPGHDCKIYDLTGPEALTFREAVERMAKGSGVPITYLEPTPEEFRKGGIEMGIPAEYLDLLIDITAPSRGGAVSPPNDTVRTILGRAPIAIEQFGKDHAAVWRG